VSGEVRVRNPDTRRLLVGAAVLLAVFAMAAPQSSFAGAARAASVTGSVCAGPVSGCREGSVLAPGARRPTAPTVLRELQMNLCNSGLAPCWAHGRAVPEAADLITSSAADTVTLNEVCDGDVSGPLFQAMVRNWPGDTVFWVFMPSWDGSRDAPYRCRNGHRYGIGILGHAAGRAAAPIVRAGQYPGQAANRREHRVWVCAYLAGAYDICTSHLNPRSGPTALQQCRYLMNAAVPQARAALGGYLPTIVGADLNLRYHGNPDVQDCVPTGWLRVGDQQVQHVLATADVRVAATQWIRLQNTDHPAWLVTLHLPTASR
jgi:hypothetical protein